MISAGTVKSAHDCSEGGFAVALAECCISHQIARGTPRLIGATIDVRRFGDGRLDSLLFGEAQARIIVSASVADRDKIIEEAKRQNVPAHLIGSVGGSDLSVQTMHKTFVWPLKDLHDAWWNSIARAMEP